MRKRKAPNGKAYRSLYVPQEVSAGIARLAKERGWSANAVMVDLLDLGVRQREALRPIEDVLETWMLAHVPLASPGLEGVRARRVATLAALVELGLAKARRGRA